MKCENCGHARKLVNTNRPSQVACHLARFDEQEEKLIDMMDVSVYSMYFKDAKPDSKKRGVMRRGILVYRDFKCVNFKE